MTQPAISPGSLAFLGPAQLPSLTEFRYVRVLSVDGSKATVAIVRLDDDEDVDNEVEVSVLRRRQVTDEESGLWPGMFVGHPIAFIQPDGIGMDEWTVGLVTGYHMFKHQPWLHIRCKDDAKQIKLEQPPNVIKVDWINYVLQTRAGSNASATNGEELLVLMDEACAQWGKSRGALPPKLAKTLTIPFEGDALVPVIRADTLAVVSVPRQHVLDCARNKKSKTGASMFEPPAGTGSNVAQKRKSSDVDVRDKRPVTRRRTLAAQASADATELGETPMGVSTSSEAGDEDDADVLAVLQQNRSLTHDAVPAGGTVTNGGGTASMLAMEEARGRSATTFRPTTLEQQIYNVIGHTDNQGKDAQCILECTQARKSRIRGAPPVLRGAFDFGFHVRGLSVMHFERVRRATPLDASGSVINITDFSRKNGLQSATTDPSYTVFMDALTNLRQFGRKFYNADTMDVLNAAVKFIEDFADENEPD
ncbi:hypothetical protein PInf_014224 [Phytophthora infestans]|nr:hypothetical protein PInf_014224 [Phytophthora infestans]